MSCYQRVINCWNSTPSTPKAYVVCLDTSTDTVVTIYTYRAACVAVPGMNAVLSMTGETLIIKVV